MPPALTDAELGAANALLAARAPHEILDWAYARFGNALAMSTSFGRNSALLLHLVATRYPSVPIIFVDPGDVAGEDRRYAKTLTARLGLSVREYRPDAPLSPEDRTRLEKSEEERREVYARRKLAPMRRALAECGARAVLHGVRADQNAHRSTLLPLSPRADGLLRVYPLLGMNAREAARYLAEHRLPIHPSGLPDGVRFECGLHL